MAAAAAAAAAAPADGACLALSACPCPLALPCGWLQVCLLDLEYGLPVQVRDAALAKQDEGLPQSDAGREYALQRMQVRPQCGVVRYGAVWVRRQLLRACLPGRGALW